MIGWNPFGYVPGPTVDPATEDVSKEMDLVSALGQTCGRLIWQQAFKSTGPGLPSVSTWGFVRCSGARLYALDVCVKHDEKPLHAEVARLTRRLHAFDMMGDGQDGREEDVQEPDEAQN